MKSFQLFPLLTSALLFVSSVHAEIKWTIDPRCFEPPAQGEAMLKAMEIAPKRAANAAEMLESANKGAKIPVGKRSRVRDVAEYLLGKEDLSGKMTAAAKKFREFAELGSGPIGRLGSNEWQAVADAAGAEHYKNFVIYCGPDLGDKHKDQQGTEVRQDNARRILIRKDHEHWKMRDVLDSGRLQGKNTLILTQTYHEVKFPGDEVRIPGSVTFQPLWLQSEGMSDRDYGLLTDTKLEAALGDDANTRFGEKEMVSGEKSTSMDFVYNGLEGSFVHELLHLNVFGGFKDEPRNNPLLAYGWLSNVKKQPSNNPDSFALLATACELIQRGYKIGKDGVIKKA